MKHARQVLIEDWDQQVVETARVAVVGCGAIGSSLAIQMVRLGIRNLTLIDPDSLEEHNLANQAYTRADIGKPKAVALKRILEGIDPSTRVRTLVARVQDLRGDLGADYVFSCPDNAATRHWLNYYAVVNRKTLIDGGIDRFRGVVKTIISGTTACQSCIPTLPQAAPRASCSGDPVPSTFVIASAIASLQAAAFLALVHGRRVPSHQHLDLRSFQLHTQKMQPNPDCVLCGHLTGGKAP